MPDPHLARLRLAEQGLCINRWSNPTAVVSAFGCIQGQDLPGVIASIALRSGDSADSVIESFNKGEIVRGYPMRGTLFACPAQDLRWITELCGEGGRTYDRKSRHERGLTDALMDSAFAELEPSLSAGISRRELSSALEACGINPSGGNAYRVIASFLHDCRLAWGPFRNGEQLLIDGSLCPGSLEQRFNGDRVAATTELATRYFDTHGTASVRDFAWWSKLPLKLIRPALKECSTVIISDDEQVTKLYPTTASDYAANKPLLLPGFDEFILGYKDRLFAMSDAVHLELVPGNNGVFKRPVVIGGTVRGFWQRRGNKLTTVDLAGIPPSTTPNLDRAFRRFPFAA